MHTVGYPGSTDTCVTAWETCDLALAASLMSSKDIDADERRLWAMEAMCDPTTVSVLSRVGLSRHWRCLEAGAGRGSIAQWLATQCLHGSVVATDTDTRYLADLRTPNLEVRQHDIVDGPGFPPGSFDLIHARALLVHLPDREAVVNRAVDWLAPDGWMVLEEPILLSADSSLEPSLCQALGAFERLLADRLGSDFQWPRRLPPRCAQSASWT